jgi:hypothetical protein
MTLLLYFLRRSSSYGMLAALGLFLFHYVNSYVYQEVIRSVEGAPAFLLRVIPKGIQAFLGLDRLPPDSINGFLALAYQHPFVILVVCALMITCCVEFLAGQVERLTLTHFLARPVHRGVLPVVAYGVCLLWLVVMIAAALLGTKLGFGRIGATLPPSSQLFALGLALFALGSAVAGLAIFFSAMTNTRSDAAGWSSSILLVMYVGNFLAQLWDAAKAWAWLSFFNHYAPVRVFAEGTIPGSDLLFLGSVAAIGLVAAIVTYSLREFRI